MSRDHDTSLHGQAINGHVGPDQASGQASSGEHHRRELSPFTLEEGVRSLGIAGMLTCIAISLSQLLGPLIPQWHGSFISVMVFLVCLESIHAQRLLSRQRLSRRDRRRFRFVEWVVLLLVVRFGIYLNYGTERLVQDVASWSADLGSFFDPLFMAYSFIVLVFWSLALSLSSSMQGLEASPIEKAPSTTDPRYDLWATTPRRGRIDRQARLNSIVHTFFWGGVVLLLLSGLSRVDVRDMVTLQHSRSSGIILNALLYFLTGLLLVSQAHYTILKANWQLQDIPILGRLGRRWVLLAVSFLLLIGLISALLPVGYSVGIIEIVSLAIQWILWVISRAVLAITFAIGYLFGLLMSLFSGDSTGAQPAALPTRPPLPAPPPTVAREPSAWWQVARSLLFWLVLTGVLGYSLWHFVGARLGLFQRLSAARLVAWLKGLWRGFRIGTRNAARRIRRTIGQRLAFRRSRAQERPRRYLSIRRLSPRERMRYFYLSVLRRAARQGYARPVSMTPSEYQETLANRLPEVSAEVRELTRAFNEARYSEHSIGRKDARSIRAIWGRIKRELTLRRRARLRKSKLSADGASASSVTTGQGP